MLLPVFAENYLSVSKLSPSVLLTYDELNLSLIVKAVLQSLIYVTVQLPKVLVSFPDEQVKQIMFS